MKLNKGDFFLVQDFDRDLCKIFMLYHYSNVEAKGSKGLINFMKNCTYASTVCHDYHKHTRYRNEWWGYENWGKKVIESHGEICVESMLLSTTTQTVEKLDGGAPPKFVDLIIKYIMHYG